MDSNNFSIGIHFFKVLVQIHYSRSPRHVEAVRLLILVGFGLILVHLLVISGSLLVFLLLVSHLLVLFLLVLGLLVSFLVVLLQVELEALVLASASGTGASNTSEWRSHSLVLLALVLGTRLGLGALVVLEIGQREPLGSSWTSSSTTRGPRTSYTTSYWTRNKPQACD